MSRKVRKINSSVRIFFIYHVVAYVMFSWASASGVATEQKFFQSSADLIRSVLSLPEEELDFARIKLSFDKIVDPSIDVEKSLSDLNNRTEIIRDMVDGPATSAQKIAAVRRYIYESGSWNDNRAFSYDHQDPLGRNIQNKLIPTYLRTRRGNCVSMPYLFLIFADRLGVDVTTSTAPLHVFVKYTNKVGHVINLETTSGANPARDAWFNEIAPMSSDAISNGVYLETLSRHETVAHMAALLVDHHLNEGDYSEALKAAYVILEFYPRDVYVMAKAGSAYAGILREEFYDKYPTPAVIPPELRDRFEIFSDRSREFFHRAENLGWRAPE